mmetsp:Transcript_3814/g.6352  ORF Transcript_3814/g.6352 Transcript_3814/m.6352 type:complete len:149 (+) Transcript_3814:33-479(+)|eukprot:CAMPEP_0119326190 /NCGR_PEP_ID=MMETSP1333-20130426/67776_1 /TAXON_ID=418940 /ORGANISM="Scyphosphaera apsteinii, Strain RCC1455" /LENGTH=148 /DNA_ID=CAMNT_0007334427 /DNA_START=12 /DNA_END=458 /DNA_ORIENTATION=+
MTEALAKEAFTIFDEDKKGTIDHETLAILIRSIGLNPTPDDLQEIFKAVDVSMSGSINVNGAMQAAAIMMSKMAATDPANDLREAFKAFDKEGDGHISCAEIQHFLTNLGPGMKLDEDEIDEIFKEIDPGGKGQVNYAEFVKVIFAKI